MAAIETFTYAAFEVFTEAIQGPEDVESIKSPSAANSPPAMIKGRGPLQSTNGPATAIPSSPW